MSRCLRYFSRGESRKTLVVVATSGDTGGAVAAGFYGVEDVDVVVMYPGGRVSAVQELQLTAWGGNIITLELQGSFDDCQAIAKRALADSDLRARARLTSANSINVARWLPQQIYYFFAIKQWEGPPPVISVPSGNFGNLAAGMLAKASGLPVGTFIAACNANDVVPRFLADGKYEPRPSVETLSNAMDVGEPSNLVRVLELFGGDLSALRQTLRAFSVNDNTTVETLRSTFNEYGYVLDPHGAVGLAALKRHLEGNAEDRGIVLGTAHPVKFDSVATVVEQPLEEPPAIRELYSRQVEKTVVPNSYDAVKELILNRI